MRARILRLFYKWASIYSWMLLSVGLFFMWSIVARNIVLLSLLYSLSLTSLMQSRTYGSMLESRLLQI